VLPEALDLVSVVLNLNPLDNKSMVTASDDSAEDSSGRKNASAGLVGDLEESFIAQFSVALILFTITHLGLKLHATNGPSLLLLPV